VSDLNLAGLVFARPELTSLVSIEGKNLPPCSIRGHCGEYSSKCQADIKYPITIY